MDIAALLLACSVHTDDALLSSIAYVHGRGSPYAVIDVGSQGLEQDDAGIVRTALSPAAARAAAERIVSIGGEPVLGLLPARPEWASEFSKELADLFDPCGSIEVASAKISEFDYSCRSRGSQRTLQRRACTLELYGRSLDLPGLRQAVVADLRLPNPFPSDGSDAAVVGPELSASLFFSLIPLGQTAALPARAPALSEPLP